MNAFEPERLVAAEPTVAVDAEAEAETGEPAVVAAPEPRVVRSDADSWARPVARLQTAAGQAPLDTVRGKRPVGAIQGFGQLWQKTYRVPLTGAGVTARDVVAYWKAHFSELWPKGNAFYGPLTGIAPGEVALLQVGVLGGLRLSTGVVVIYVDDESFTFMTPEGHIFAGWITFSAADAAAATGPGAAAGPGAGTGPGAVAGPGAAAGPEAGAGATAQVHVLMRAQSPMSELGLTLGGHRQEDRFWQATLTNLASRLGVPEPAVETQVVCVDRRRQWRRASNIRYDSTFRSVLFTAAAPLRWARRSVGRR